MVLHSVWFQWICRWITTERWCSMLRCSPSWERHYRSRLKVAAAGVMLHTPLSLIFFLFTTVMRDIKFAVCLSVCLSVCSGGISSRQLNGCGRSFAQRRRSAPGTDSRILVMIAIIGGFRGPSGPCPQDAKSRPLPLHYYSANNMHLNPILVQSTTPDIDTNALMQRHYLS